VRGGEVSEAGSLAQEGRVTPKPPILALRNNGDIKLEEAVFEDPKAAARKWLQEYIEKKRKEEECKET